MPAPATSPRPKRALRAWLLVRREALIAQARRQRDLRQSKSASTSEAELRGLNIAILSLGPALID